MEVSPPNAPDIWNKKMNQEQPSIVKILWFCFTGCPVVYFLIGYSILPQANKTIVLRPSDLSGTLFMFFAVLSLAAITFTHVYLPKFLEIPDEKKKNTIRFTQYALSEAIAIMGLVLSFIGGNFTELAVLCGVSLISFFKLYPEES